MTRASGANMPQRKVNSPEWHYKYRQCHQSDAGGARQQHDNNWLYISRSRIHCKVISASFSVAGESKWAASAPLIDNMYDRLSPNQTNYTNTLPSLYIQELWVFFFFYPLPCALFIMLHEGGVFNVVDMQGSLVFHVEHGAAPAGSLGTKSEYQVLWRHYSTSLFINSHAPMVTHRHKHKDVRGGGGGGQNLVTTRFILCFCFSRDKR